MITCFNWQRYPFHSLHKTKSINLMNFCAFFCMQTEGKSFLKTEMTIDDLSESQKPSGSPKQPAVSDTGSPKSKFSFCSVSSTSVCNQSIFTSDQQLTSLEQSINLNLVSKSCSFFVHESEFFPVKKKCTTLHVW